MIIIYIYIYINQQDKDVNRKRNIYFYQIYDIVKIYTYIIVKINTKIIVIPYKIKYVNRNRGIITYINI